MHARIGTTRAQIASLVDLTLGFCEFGANSLARATEFYILDNYKLVTKLFSDISRSFLNATCVIYLFICIQLNPE